MPEIIHPFAPLIAETVATTGAASIICLGNLPWPDTAPACICLEQTAVLQAAGLPSRAELAVAMPEAGTTAREARQLIAALRDLLAQRLLVFVPENLLDDTALVGLGLTRQARYELEGRTWQAWSYDIRTYKSVPDWLNPRFWANPENWGRYRW